MKYYNRLPKTGRLERVLSEKTVASIPNPETVQCIEITRRPDGTTVETNEDIIEEKQRKIDLLEKKYGIFDQNEIVWVFVKRNMTV